MAVGPPEAAGWNPLSLIRDGIRLTTVLLMKDRSGRVGGNGVARLLRDITRECPNARISLGRALLRREGDAFSPLQRTGPQPGGRLGPASGTGVVVLRVHRRL